MHTTMLQLWGEFKVDGVLLVWLDVIENSACLLPTRGLKRPGGLKIEARRSWSQASVASKKLFAVVKWIWIYFLAVLKYNINHPSAHRQTPASYFQSHKLIFICLHNWSLKKEQHFLLHFSVIKLVASSANIATRFSCANYSLRAF